MSSINLNTDSFNFIESSVNSQVKYRCEYPYVGYIINMALELFVVF